jgi:hypothetical protein
VELREGICRVNTFFYYFYNPVARCLYRLCGLWATDPEVPGSILGPTRFSEK